MKYRFEVLSTEINQRIDKFLAEKLSEYSRSYIQKLILDKDIKVNGILVKSNYKLSLGDIIDIDISSPVEYEVLPEDIFLDIIYEDEDLLIVNKPKGMVVHPSAGHYSGTLVNAVMYHCKDSLSGIGGVMRPGIVHRIDKDTTGLLVVCKTDKAHNSISAQFKEHSITRKYYAVVYGNIKEDEGTVNMPIARHNIDRKKMATTQKNGKEAVTHYKVLERFGQYTYVECQLETGRTHQIRVHMASIKHPLLGDSVYGPERTKFAVSIVGQTLHAKTLGFKHPKTNKYIEFNSELPEYFNKVLTKLRM